MSSPFLEYLLTPISSDFPIGPLASNTSTLSGYTYGNGTYTLSSYDNSSDVWKAFDDALNTNYQGSHTFDPIRVWTGPSVIINGITYAGPWIQITLPTAIFLDKLQLSPTNKISAPQEMTLFGSNDERTTLTIIWQLAYYEWPTIIGSNNFPLQTFIVDANTQYSTYRLVWTSIDSDGTYLPRIAEMNLIAKPI